MPVAVVWSATGPKPLVECNNLAWRLVCQGGRSNQAKVIQSSGITPKPPGPASDGLPQ